MRRLRRVRRALVAGTVIVAVALTVLAARGFSGHASAAAQHLTLTPSGTAQATRRPAAAHRAVARRARPEHRRRFRKGLSPPSAPPAAAQSTTTTSPAPVISGGS
jgi:hypothetical protein